MAIYCDTGVENPIINAFVKTTILSLRKEARKDGVAFDCKVIAPQVDQSFFMRIIGRGYPPPTNSFRWCTKDIRIRPFQRFLRARSDGTLIAVGTRIGESQQRDRSLRKSIDFKDEYKFYQKQRDGFAGAVLFTPIIDFDIDDVWTTLVDLKYPRSINTATLAQLYRYGSGECPAIRDFKDKPCSRARFGCWTCTVIRRDRSAEKMIEGGYFELLPYFEFRQWLTEIRNDPKYRCRYRRSGKPGLGPFNLKGRQLILEKLHQLETEIGHSVLSPAERTRIRELWEQDLSSQQYATLE